MKVPFIPADKLKRQYGVFGHFYSLQLPAVAPQKCRSVLEISATTAGNSPIADAVFVMMNPGSSRPVQETSHSVSSDQVSGMLANLVPTVPDMTQYQVMRIMYFKGWQNVKVINLSDLRDPQSGAFAERYVQLEKDSGTTVHSIFSPERAAQLKRYLSRKPGGPIVCAWGVSDDLNPLIERASKSLAQEMGVTGLEKPGNAGRYFHPLPSLQRQREQWVIEMLERLNA
ncbi:MULTISPECIES: DUF1643 domain-containing protein [Thauera]|uniref:DUF1643 domain-containing protein n=1 Tax=Thauera aminoaromatica TaxID=164330 RepID=A0A5C7SPX5_THASP|nr:MULTISPECIES: DUF1643 domain-containing protein [Thauera]MBP6131151.1 hypothetical protein [Thauera sp.]TXH85874.1 MAG: DUF1643 domain-containing protein [Thauera aminoaromatica]